MTSRRAFRILAPMLAATLAACGGSAPALPVQQKVGPVAGEAAIDKPFVGFQQSSLTISRLETPVAPPVTPGSMPSPTTIGSDSPEVVGIQADGSLVAHRNGRATIRALQGGGTLAVEVLASTGLHAEPPSLRTGPGTHALPVLRSGDATVPAGSVSWFSSAPDVAMVEDGRIRAGPSRGTATLTAVYGDERVRVPIVVGDQGPRAR